MSSGKQQWLLPEVDSAPHNTSKMEVSLKKFNGFRLLNNFTKSPILDVLQVSEFASDFNSLNAKVTIV